MQFNGFQQQQPSAQYMNPQIGQFMEPNMGQYNFGSNASASQQPQTQPTKISAAEVDSYIFEIITNIDNISTKFVEGAQQTLNKLVCSKVELSKKKNALEDQIDVLKDRNAVCDSNIQALQQQNGRLQ